MNRSIYYKAIEALESATNACNMRFDISYSDQRGVTRYFRKWRIKVEGKTFYDDSFIVVSKKAIRFALTLHKLKNKWKK